MAPSKKTQKKNRNGALKVQPPTGENPSVDTGSQEQGSIPPPTPEVSPNPRDPKMPRNDQDATKDVAPHSMEDAPTETEVTQVVKTTKPTQKFVLDSRFPTNPAIIAAYSVTHPECVVDDKIIKTARNDLTTFAKMSIGVLNDKASALGKQIEQVKNLAQTTTKDTAPPSDQADRIAKNIGFVEKTLDILEKQLKNLETEFHRLAKKNAAPKAQKREQKEVSLETLMARQQFLMAVAEIIQVIEAEKAAAPALSSGALIENQP